MTNEHQDGEREAYTYSPQDGDNGHCFSAQVWDADGNSVAIVDGKDANEANARAKMITEALNARARLDKAAVEPVPVDAVEWIVEAYPVHDAKYLDTLGLDAEGRPYALKQRLGGKSEDQ